MCPTDERNQRHDSRLICFGQSRDSMVCQRRGCTSAFVCSTGGPESSIGEPGHTVVDYGLGELWRTESRHERSRSMDGTTATLKAKLDLLLREAAQVSVALDQADGTI